MPFFVYAATNDETYNHEIVMYCKKNGILCGSAVRDENVSVSSMMQSVQEKFYASTRYPWFSTGTWKKDSTGSSR